MLIEQGIDTQRTMINIPRKDKFRKKAQRGPKIDFEAKVDRQSHGFYKNRPWRNLRTKYIELLTQQQMDFIETIPESDAIILEPKIPICERCLSLYKSQRRKPDQLLSGKPLDHIDPVNPENPMDSEGFGDPLSMENVQLLCHSHHHKKTVRDQKILKRKM